MTAQLHAHDTTRPWHHSERQHPILQARLGSQKALDASPTDSFRHWQKKDGNRKHLTKNNILSCAPERNSPPNWALCLCHGWVILVTSDAVNLENPLSFVPLAQNLWTLDERKAKMLCGGYVKRGVSCERRVGSNDHWQMSLLCCLIPVSR